MQKVEYYKGRGFWKPIEEYPKVVYPINDKIIAEAEEILQVKLPDAYKDLIKERNGGEVNYPYIAIKSGEYDYEQRFPSLEGICLEDDDISIITSERELTDPEVNIHDKFIVLWSDCHNWIVLDYRNTKENPPVLYITEDYSQEEISWTYIPIAASFEDFLSLLYQKPLINPKSLKPSFSRKK